MATNGADKQLPPDARNGNHGSSRADVNGGGGGGGEDLREGFAGSIGGVGVDPGNQADALRGQDERHVAESHDNRLQRPRRDQHGREGKVLGKVVSTARSFYDPSEIALRSRRVCSAYGGDRDRDGGWGSFSPRRADIVRHAKVHVVLLVLVGRLVTILAVCGMRRIVRQTAFGSDTFPRHLDFSKKFSTISLLNIDVSTVCLCSSLGILPSTANLRRPPPH